MKKTFFLATLALAVFSAFGQTPDTTYTTIGQTSEAFEKTRFIDRYDHVFGTQTPTKFLLKWNTLGALPIITQGQNLHVLQASTLFNSPTFDLRAEVKLAPMLSIQGSGSFSRYFRVRYGLGSVSPGGHSVVMRVEPRWYFDMPSRIRAGKSANNLTGNYIGLEGSTNKYWSSDHTTSESNSLGLRFGMQRRLWRYGFFDLSYGVLHQSGFYQFIDITGTPQESKYRGFYGDARVAMGFALGGRKPQHDGAAASVCDVFRCFQEDRRMFKIDLFRALRFAQNTFAFHPRVSWEQKIGQSPFSVEMEGELEVVGFRLFNKSDVYSNWQKEVGVSIQPRYYFSQKRQIARGKSGNNLNGLFLGNTLGYRWVANSLYTAPHIGAQYRLFKKGFIQYKFGLQWSKLQLDEFPGDPTSWYSDLKIGVAF